MIVIIDTTSGKAGTLKASRINLTDGDAEGVNVEQSTGMQVIFGQGNSQAIVQMTCASWAAALKKLSSQCSAVVREAAKEAEENGGLSL